MKASEWGKYIEGAKASMDQKLAQADELLAAIQTKLDESENGKDQAASVLASINKSYQQVTELIQETTTELNQVATLRTTAFDPTTGIEAVLTKATTLATRAEGVAEEITQLRKSASDDVDKVGESLRAAKNDQAAITDLRDEADALLEELQKTYALAINTGLAGSFDNRRKDIETTFVKKWARRFSVSVAVLLVAAIVVLWISFSDGFSVGRVILFRLSLLSPLLFYTTYTAIQYAIERRLLEKYAFKAVVAASLDSYTTLLQSQFGKKDPNGKLLDFVIESMRSIYSEPHEIKPHRSVSLGVKTSKFAHIVGEAKEEIIDTIHKEVSPTEP